MGRLLRELLEFLDHKRFDLEGVFSLVEVGLEVVGHGFEGAVAILELSEAEGVVHQETFGAEVGPLEDVDEFVEVEGFIHHQRFLDEISVQVGDAGGVQVFKIGKGREVEAPGAQGRDGQLAGESDDFRALEEFFRIIQREATKTKGGHGARLRGVGRKGVVNPRGGEREDAFEDRLQVHKGW